MPCAVRRIKEHENNNFAVEGWDRGDTSRKGDTSGNIAWRDSLEILFLGGWGESPGGLYPGGEVLITERDFLLSDWWVYNPGRGVGEDYWETPQWSSYKLVRLKLLQYWWDYRPFQLVWFHRTPGRGWRIAKHESRYPPHCSVAADPFDKYPTKYVNWTCSQFEIRTWTCSHEVLPRLMPDT